MPWLLCTWCLGHMDVYDIQHQAQTKQQKHTTMLGSMPWHLAHKAFCFLARLGRQKGS